jgi:hypothetical protein
MSELYCLTIWSTEKITWGFLSGSLTAFVYALINFAAFVLLALFQLLIYFRGTKRASKYMVLPIYFTFLQGFHVLAL